MKTALACVALVLSHGCAGEETGCVPAPLTPRNASAKADFAVEWTHVAGLLSIEGDLDLEVGAETPARGVSWMITEEVLLLQGESAEEPQIGFSIAAHVTLGSTSSGAVCSIETEVEWFERDHFGVDWTRDLIAAEASVPGASGVDTSEWLIEPLSNFVEPGIGLLEADFVYDSAGQLQSFFLPLKYLVRPCNDCEPSVVNVVHRFERVE